MVQDFLGTLEAKVGTAAHQDRCECPRRDPGEDHRDGQDDNELIDKRALGDAPNHRQLALRLNPFDVLRGYRGIIDYNTSGFHRGLARECGHIVNAGSSGAGDQSDVVKQRK